jgi:hypothetical protein|tara:strand:+ start:634 stop:897 length:264 start_codon:yes stop_codon:yes gene_type:complete
MQSKLQQKVIAHTAFLEALGVVEKWQEKSPSENKQLTRLAELLLGMLDRHQNLLQEIDDLELANSLIRKSKNDTIVELKKEILTLKQ